MSTEAHPLIVIVEDEAELAKVISIHLEEAEMHSQVCLCAAHALRFLEHNFANLMLLDLNLPDQSGFSLLNELKAKGIDVPTIFLTGNTEELNKVKGLEMGADDYMTKPFSYPELLARIRAVLRRTEGRQDLNLTPNARISDTPFSFAGANVIPERLEIVFSDGGIEKIGKKELGVLAFLSSNAGVVITRKALIHAVWGEHADLRSRSLDQYIVKIRDLYHRHGNNLDNFRTIHGIGYTYEPGK
jgi:DNA-binding response OmpR family regulator